MSAAPAVGIDLGTSNSCVAVARNGVPEALADAHGAMLQASAVSYLPNFTAEVGNAAHERLTIDPKNTIVSAKRLIGRVFRHPVVDEMRRRYLYDIREGSSGLPKIVTRAGEVSVPEVSGAVLRKMAQIASQALGEQVTRAVITVPANFNDAQRRATQIAGQLAGLEVLRIVNEPTAAALAYGHGQQLDRRIVVYDFGGGTLDVTILEVRGNVFEVMATAGDPYLGGDDFDHRLIDGMVAAFLHEHHYDLSDDDLALMRLRQAAERMKIELSSADSATVRVDELMHGRGGAPVALSFTMSRAAFEEKGQDLVQRSFIVCNEALRIAGLHSSQVDEIAMVGGTTRMPMVRKMVGEFFGMEPRVDLDPDRTVALGAALQAEALTTAGAFVASEIDVQPVSLPPLPPPSREFENGPAGFGERPLMGLPDEGSPARRVPAGDTQGAMFAPFPAGVEFTLSEAQAAAATMLPLPENMSEPLSSAVADLVPSHQGMPLSEVPDLPEAIDGPREAGPGSIGRLKLKRIVAIATESERPNPPAQEGERFGAPPGLTGSGAPVPQRPVLLDVTPHALSVATVGGYSETVIPRNSPIPIEQKRVFGIARSGQNRVRILVLQGDSNLVDACSSLGELLIEDLPATTRGEIKIDVFFEVNTDGMLRVRAVDSLTGHERKTTLSIAGAVGDDELDRLRLFPEAG